LVDDLKLNQVFSVQLEIIHLLVKRRTTNSMPGVIEPETMNVDDLPAIWSPVQWEMSDEERAAEIELQATASLLHAIDVPEAILRLLLDETEIERAFTPPLGFDPEQQGEWDPDIVTFKFSRPIRLVQVERDDNYLRVEYDFQGLGRWELEIGQETLNLRRV
jgi:hypothetical protein